jgi:hypothetical protein
MMGASTASGAAYGKRSRFEALRNARANPSPSQDRIVLSE